MDPSEQYPSKSDTTAKQLSIADLRASREAAEKPREASVGSGSEPPASARNLSRGTASSPALLVPQQHSTDGMRLEHLNDPVVTSTWDGAAVVMILALAAGLGLVWYGIVYSINVFIPAFALIVGGALGLATARTMGAGRIYGLLAAVLTFLVSYGVLVLGIVIRGDFIHSGDQPSDLSGFSGAQMVALLSEGPRDFTFERLMMVPIAAHVFLLVGVVLAYWLSAKE
ncbi:hypothetical protein GC173_13145 [bacterium]|nr:hypothetical protein [bacterium]